jgi:hypothetical protein
MALLEEGDAPLLQTVFATVGGQIGIIASLPFKVRQLM